MRLSHLALGAVTGVSLATAAPSPPVAFVDVAVIAMATPGVVEHQTVIVRDGRVAAVGPRAAVPVPAGATVIDGRGKYLVPGLVDMHAHVQEDAELAQLLSAGVTTVRDLMGSPETLRMKRAVAGGALVGARLVAAGPLFAGPEVRWRNKVVPADAAAARAEVRRQRDAGYDLVKVYDGLTRPVYDAVLAEAHALGMRVTGHIPRAVGLGGALAGRQDVEHTDKIVADVWGHALDTARVDSVARAIAAAGVYVTPTIASMQQLARVQGGGWDSLLARPAARRVGPAALDVWCTATAPLRGTRATPAGVRYNAYTDFQMRLVNAERRAGVPLLAGTDYPNAVLAPGSGLVEELVALTEAGLSRDEALRAATVTAGRAIGDTLTGVVVPGARADLVLLDASPLADLHALDRPAGVVAAGRWLPRAELDRLAPPRAEAPRCAP